MTTDSAERADQVGRLRDGGEQALADLFSEYRDRLKRMVRFRLDRRLFGRVDASDVLQEAYLDAVKRVHHYVENPSMPFFVWLRLITGQTLIDVHRHHLGAQMRGADQEVSMERGGVPHASSMCLAAQFVGHLTSPSQAAMRAETLARLQTALDDMDPMDREILALRHFEELGNNEAAEVLGLQKAAASNRYVRALRRLKEALAGVPGFSEAGGEGG
jgi:RNA polymerase sigma-70 factor (ECF subfamily)